MSGLTRRISTLATVPGRGWPLRIWLLWLGLGVFCGTFYMAGVAAVLLMTGHASALPGYAECFAIGWGVVGLGIILAHKPWWRR